MVIHHLRDTFRDGFTMGRLAIEYDTAQAYTRAGWTPTGPTAAQDYGFIVEDRDRGLDAAMALAEIERRKVAKETCIPAGRYRVRVTMSQRFGRMMPLLLDVPGFRGIRIHVVKTAGWTEGCVGAAFARDVATGRVDRAEAATAWLTARIEECEARGEPVWWAITRDAAAWAAYSSLQR